MVGELAAGQCTVEAAEEKLILSVARIGATALQAVMQARINQADADRATPPDLVREGRRPIWVRSLWGDFQIVRAYYSRKGGGEGQTPSDCLLQLWDSYTPGMAKVLCRLTPQMPFEQVAELLHSTTGATVGGRQVHRFTEGAADAARRWTAGIEPPEDPADRLYVSFDGTGVPMRRDCLVGRKGRGADGCAKTREMRLGCVFTQSGTDDQGHAIRDPDSTTYIAALLDSKLFGREIKAEAWRRGMADARRVVVITDGAKWCATIASTLFGRATHILDFYHAAEHLHSLAEAVFGQGREAEIHFRRWRRMLRRGEAPAIVAEARATHATAVDQEAIRRETTYLRNNIERMRYDQFLREGLFIGSGVIEAGRKTVVGNRAKRSGMQWSVPGVQNILDLRCTLLSGRMDQFLKHALAQRRAA